VGALLENRKSIECYDQNLVSENETIHANFMWLRGSPRVDDEVENRRKYYQRTNDLIQMYLYIDRLLDSSIPHELLNEYSVELDASQYKTVTVPQTITEEPPTPISPQPGDLLSTPPKSGGSPMPTSSSSTSISKKVQRTPKDIFRSSENMPLLAARDEEEGAGYGAVESDDEADPNRPKPEIPWLEDGVDLDSSDPIVTAAIWVNIAANTVLLLGKIIVLASAPSMSVLASLVDAILDFLSTAIVWTTTRLIASSHNDQFSYPVGRRR
jgi:hypothetical protein